MIQSIDYLPGLLDVVFKKMDGEDIQYCLLRDIDRISLMSGGGEIDILVREEQLSRLAGLLAKIGFARLPSWGYEPHHFFAAYEPEMGVWFKLDVVVEIAFGKPVPFLKTGLASHCLKYRRKTGNIYIASPEDELFMLLFHCILDKGRFETDKQDRLLRLGQQIRDESYLTTLLNTYVGEGMDCQQLLRLIVAGDYPSLLARRKTIRARYEKDHRVASILKRVASKGKRKLNQWITSGRPPSLMVALLAPDGAGKSTLASGIRESFYSPVKTIYMGLYQKGRKERVVSHIPGISILWQIGILWRRYLTACYHRARRRLVIFDRYSYDARLSRSGETGVRKIRRWLIAHACPPPDLIFLLDAPGEVLYQRKHEHSYSFLEYQRQSYLALQPSFPQMQIIDATAGQQEVERAVIHRIWKKIIQNQSGRKISDVDRKVQKDAGVDRNKKIAYVVSHFPKITETFVLYEMIAMEQNGIAIELYPLIRERTKVVQPEAIPFIARAHYQPFLSWPTIQANLYYFRRKPGVYLSTLLSIMKRTWGSFRLFTGSILFFPKSVLFAYQMAQDGITHVHAHFARHAATTAFVIQRLAGIPYSFTAHGSDIHCERRMLREKVAEADFVVPISNFNRSVILDECKGQYQEKLKVIHCGVDLQKSFKLRPWDGVIGKKTPVSMICIGTLHEVKGQAYLIDSCKQLKDAGYDFVCHFVGDGPDRESLVAKAHQAGIDSIIFHGLLTRPEIIQMLQETDIAVTPSVPTKDGRREGIPIVIMEAMASGVPVVASNISGIPELVEDNHTGFLTAPRDVSSLTAAIEKLIQRPDLRKQFGKAGREKIEKEFDLQLNAAKLANCFQQDE